MIIFKRDSERLKIEFDEQIDERLRIILYAFAEHLKYTRNEWLIITHLRRTQKEQDEIYKSPKMAKAIREAYIKCPWYSVHQSGRGADVGIAGIKNPEEEEEWLNEHFRYGKINPRSGAEYPTAKLENFGLGGHIHIQVCGCGFTRME